ncbi:MAG: hypothetical protein U1F68_20235 [Gammaproteobacteria bacterium]
MKAYSMDLRERVLWASATQGCGTKAVAERFQVSESWDYAGSSSGSVSVGELDRVIQRRPHPGWQSHAEAIRAAVGQHPDATLSEYRERFALPLSRSALSRALIELGLPRKSRCAPLSRIARMCTPGGKRGGPRNQALTPRGWCSWTRPGRARRSDGPTVAAPAVGGW